MKAERSEMERQPRGELWLWNGSSDGFANLH